MDLYPNTFQLLILKTRGSSCLWPSPLWPHLCASLTVWGGWGARWALLSAVQQAPVAVTQTMLHGSGSGMGVCAPKAVCLIDHW